MGAGGGHSVLLQRDWFSHTEEGQCRGQSGWRGDGNVCRLRSVNIS